MRLADPGQHELFDQDPASNDLPLSVRDFLRANRPGVSLTPENPLLEMGSLGLPVRDLTLSLRTRDSIIARHQIVERMKEQGYSELTATILTGRNVALQSPSEDFLQTSLRPWLRRTAEIKNLDQSAQRIVEAIRNGETIVGFGDNDIDGTTSLAPWVVAMRYWEVSFPVRQWCRRTESYGFTEPQRRWAEQQRADLVLLFDLGTSDKNELDKFFNDVVVTDHHIVDTVPTKYFINPQQTGGGEAFRGLAAAPLSAFLLLRVNELLGRPLPKKIIAEVCMLAGVGQVVDQGSLTGPGRAITAFTVKYLARTVSPGIASLLTKMKAVEPNSSTIGFGIGPAIGSFLRLFPRDSESGQPNAGSALELLTCEEPETGERLATTAVLLNKLRQQREDECVAKAWAKLRVTHKRGETAAAIVLDEDYSDVAGPASSRLRDKIGLSICIASRKSDGHYSVSIRTADGHNAKAIVVGLADITTRGGGHIKAAGCSIPADKIHCLPARFGEEARRSGVWKPESRTPDLLMTLAEMIEKAPELIESSLLLQPTGKDNPHLTVRLEGVSLARAICDRRSHVDLQLTDGKRYFRANAFHQNLDVPWITKGRRGLISVSEEPVTVLISPEQAPWLRKDSLRQTLTGTVQGIVPVTPVTVSDETIGHVTQSVIEERAEVKNASVLQAMGGTSTLFDRFDSIAIPATTREFEQRYYQKPLLRHENMQWRGAQIGMISRLLHEGVLDDWAPQVLQAETGSGKTLLAILYLLPVIAAGQQAVYFTRDDTLVQQVKEELLRYSSLQDRDISVLTGAIPKHKRTILDKLFFIGTSHEWIANQRLLKSNEINVGAIFFDEGHHLNGNDPSALVFAQALRLPVPPRILTASGTMTTDFSRSIRRQQRFRTGPENQLETSSPRRVLTVVTVPMELDIKAMEQHLFHAGKKRCLQVLSLLREACDELLLPGAVVQSRAVINELSLLLKRKVVITPFECRRGFPDLNTRKQMRASIQAVYALANETRCSGATKGKVGRCLGLMSEIMIVDRLRDYTTSSSAFLLLHQASRAAWQSVIPESGALNKKNKGRQGHSWDPVLREIIRPLLQLAKDTPYAAVLNWYRRSRENPPVDNGLAFVREHAPKLFERLDAKSSTAYQVAKNYFHYSLVKTARMTKYWDMGEEVLCDMIAGHGDRIIVGCKLAVEARYLQERLTMLLKNRGAHVPIAWVAGQKYMSSKKQQAVQSMFAANKNSVLIGTPVIAEGRNYDVDRLISFSVPHNLTQRKQYEGRTGRFSGYGRIDIIVRTGCAGKKRLTSDQIRLYTSNSADEKRKRRSLESPTWRAVNLNSSEPVALAIEDSLLF